MRYSFTYDNEEHMTSLLICFAETLPTSSNHTPLQHCHLAPSALPETGYWKRQTRNQRVKGTWIRYKTQPWTISFVTSASKPTLQQQLLKTQVIGANIRDINLTPKNLKPFLTRGRGHNRENNAEVTSFHKGDFWLQLPKGNSQRT